MGGGIVSYSAEAKQLVESFNIKECKFHSQSLLSVKIRGRFPRSANIVDFAKSKNLQCS
jgi:hypothetical protein